MRWFALLAVAAFSVGSTGWAQETDLRLPRPLREYRPDKSRASEGRDESVSDAASEGVSDSQENLRIPRSLKVYSTDVDDPGEETAVDSDRELSPSEIAELARALPGGPVDVEPSPSSNAELERALARAQQENLELKIALQRMQVERVSLAQDAGAEEAAVVAGSIWQDLEIPVSWEDFSRFDDFQRERQIVEAAIKNTWEKACAIRFTGWKKARAGDARGIFIRVSDEGPHCRRLGRHLDGLRNGMVLNFTFNNWGRNTLRGSAREGGIYKIAVHEFGHALGLAHEQNRPDAPPLCRISHRQGTTGDLAITQYDPKSVMNYCNLLYINGGVLSPLDKEGIAFVYGPSDAAPEPRRASEDPDEESSGEEFPAEDTPASDEDETPDAALELESKTSASAPCCAGCAWLLSLSSRRNRTDVGEEFPPEDTPPGDE